MGDIAQEKLDVVVDGSLIVLAHVVRRELVAGDGGADGGLVERREGRCDYLPAFGIKLRLRVPELPAPVFENSSRRFGVEFQLDRYLLSSVSSLLSSPLL